LLLFLVKSGIVRLAFTFISKIGLSDNLFMNVISFSLFSFTLLLLLVVLVILFRGEVHGLLDSTILNSDFLLELFIFVLEFLTLSLKSDDGVIL